MTTNEQQEAVCGTCGQRKGAMCACGFPLHRIRSHRYAGSGEPEGDPHHPFIPAPVVPSDERVGGLILEPFPTDDEDGWVNRGQRQTRTSVDGERRQIRNLVTGEWVDYYFAPPTPSQDAEGDGELKARTDLYTAITMHFDRHIPMEDVAKKVYAYRDAIREPYEALVKAARRALRHHGY